MAQINYDDMAYRICHACIRELASKEYHETIKEKIKRTIEDMPEVEPVGNSNKWGKWIITAEDNDGVHRIQCPFCRYEKGSDFIDYITVTFEKFPPFCENCGAKMDGGSKQ